MAGLPSGSPTGSPSRSPTGSPSGSPTGSPSGSLPGAGTRWRCAACGNLTRFDVTRQTRRREFWHLDLAGGAQVEEADTLADDVLEVCCRWCGRNDMIELVPRPLDVPESDNGTA